MDRTAAVSETSRSNGTRKARVSGVRFLAVAERLLTVAVGFSPRVGEKRAPASRQRRLNQDRIRVPSGVAPRRSAMASLIRGLNSTATFMASLREDGEPAGIKVRNCVATRLPARLNTTAKLCPKYLLAVEAACCRVALGSLDRAEIPKATFTD